MPCRPPASWPNPHSLPASRPLQLSHSGQLLGKICQQRTGEAEGQPGSLPLSAEICRVADSREFANGDLCWDGSFLLPALHEHLIGHIPRLSA